MDNNNNLGSFLKGALVGALAGAVAGVLLAPKAGEETRKDLHKLAKNWADKASDMYSDAMEMVNEKVSAMKAVGKRLDEKKYMDLVGEVVNELKGTRGVAADVASKLGAQLKRDWKKVQRAWMGE